MSDVGGRMSDVGCQMSDFRCHPVETPMKQKQNRFHGASKKRNRFHGVNRCAEKQADVRCQMSVEMDTGMLE